MRLPPACAVLLGAGSLLLASCGGSAPQRHGRPTAGAGRDAPNQRAASLDGPMLSSPAPEPALRLPNYRGREVNLTEYRGKAVLLTFIYTHCRTECPLIAADLHAALEMLGPRAREVQVIGVSTDPRGDTPAAVREFLAKHEMTGRMQYLLGTRAMLEPVWRAWHVSASIPGTNDVVTHTALVYGISATGKVMTVYPANFRPAEVAHDVPLLAAL